MSKPTNFGGLLTRAVVASTLFVNLLAYADTTVDGVNSSGGVIFAPPLVTSTAENITIAPAGRINSGADAIRINDANRTITVLPNNINASQAIIATQNTIEVCDGNAACGGGAGDNAIIIIGENAQLLSTNTNIILDANNSSLTNASLIQGGNYSIWIQASGSNATIVNESTGIIRGGGVFGGILVEAPGLTLTNMGRIDSTHVGGGAAIRLSSNFNVISNTSTGSIDGSFGGGDTHAIRIVNPISGIIQNSGIISGGMTGRSAITIENNFTGDISNMLGGTLQTFSGAGGRAINAAANFTTINNDGLIQAPAAGDNAILVSANTTGIINNNGTGSILANSLPAIQLDGNVLEINNRGSLSTLTGSEAILGAAGITINNGLNNWGDITNETAGMNAIDFSLAGNTPITQNSGTITGNILLGTGGNTLTLNGGVIDGNVTGGAGIDSLVINAAVPVNGTIAGLDNITVNNAGTNFAPTFPVTGMSGVLTINSPAQMTASANLSGGGNVVNNGILTVPGTVSFGVGSFTNNSGSILSLEENAFFTVNATSFTHDAGATLDVTLVDSTTHGQLFANIPGAGTTVFNAGSTIRPNIAAFMPNGTTFNVVNDIGAGGTIIDNSSLTQTSALVNFSKILIGNTIIQLQANRNSFASLSSNEITESVANALDILATGNGPSNPELLGLLGQFDQLPTQVAVEEAMESLLPPFNFGRISAAQLSMSHIFDGIQDRVQANHLSQCRKYPHHCKVPQDEAFAITDNGINFGDMGEWGSVWGRLTPYQLDQTMRQGLPGYRTRGLSASAGIDGNINNCALLGFAASVSKATVSDKAPNPKNEKIVSWQATLYGGFEFQYGFYLDLMFALASNHYDINREMHINEINTAAVSAFNGKQYGFQTDLSWSFAQTNYYYVSPFARLKYIHLTFNNYVEKGAGDISLNVVQDNPTQLQGGIGFKAGTMIEKPDVLWVPGEFTLLVANDFKNDGEVSLASFVGGGPAFSTNGITPGRASLNLAMEMSALVKQKSFFSLKYSVEFRDHFISNLAFVQFEQTWG